MKIGRYFINKSRKKKCKQNFPFSKMASFIFIFILKYAFINLTMKNNIRILSNYFSEIHLVIQGTGASDQKFISNLFYKKPSEVWINGNRDSNCENTCKCTLPVGKNNMTLRFDGEVNSFSQIFYNVANIIEIDFSNFDSSSVTTMYWMFYKCSDLEKVNFDNIDTSQVTNMECMFSTCTKIQYLDLSDFNTSKVTTMYKTFGGCSQLTHVELSSFDTSNVNDMHEMFTGCSSLKYLDLSNFNTGKVTTIVQMFYQCSSLIYLNVKSFKFDNLQSSTSAFYTSSSKIKLCAIDSSVTDTFSDKTFDCTDNCFKANIKIDDTQGCIETCNDYEYNNICFDACPKGTLTNGKICEDNKCDRANHNEIECLGNVPEGYYFDSGDETYKKCFQACKFCSGEGDEINNNCIEYKSSGSSKSTELAYTSEVLIEKNNPSISTALLKQIYSTNINSINDRSNSIILTDFNIISSNPIVSVEISENLYSTNNRDNPDKLNTITVSEFDNISISSKDYDYSSNTINNNDNNDIILELLKQILFNNFNNSINKNQINLDKENHDEVLRTIQKIIKDGFDIKIIDAENIPSLSVRDFNYTITSTLIQQINQNKNGITVDLGKCEDKLKDEYRIEKNDSLYLLIVNGKVDNIPKVEYEVFYPFSSNNFSILNLTHCENMKIDISMPVDIPPDDIDKYNKSSGLYNDICYTLTTENNTDISLKDRRNEYVEKNYSLCEEDCDFTAYDNATKRAKCSCMSKIKLPLISDIKVDKDKLISNFKDIRNIGNFKMLKCTNLLFNKKNIFKNSANYMIFILFTIGILAIFIYICYNNNKIKEYILQLSKKLKMDKVKNINTIYEYQKNKTKFKGSIKKADDNNTNRKILSNNNKHSIQKKSKSLFNINFNQINYKNDSRITENYINPNNKSKNKKKKSKDKKVKKNKFQLKNKEEQSNAILKTKDFTHKKETSKEKEKENFGSYNDEEMNSLEYEEAKKRDKRTYFQFYLSLLKTNHILIFTFCNISDYNSQMMKIYIFFYIFIINFTVSAMFYSDETMHKIYTEKGAFDFTYQLPQMIYSFIISSILEIALGFLGLYEGNIIEIKNTKDKKDKNKQLCIIKCKVFFFFFVTYILLFFIWLYIGCFCAVYKNTQMHLLKDVLSSFAISFITPFFTCLLPGLLRIPSLQSKSNRKILYKISNFLQKL